MRQSRRWLWWRKGAPPIYIRDIVYRNFLRGPDVLCQLLEQRLGELSVPLTPAQQEMTIRAQAERIEALQRQIARLQEELCQQHYLNLHLTRRVAELEGQVAPPVKDSHNSHRPPASDLPARNPRQRDRAAARRACHGYGRLHWAETSLTPVTDFACKSLIEK